MTTTDYYESCTKLKPGAAEDYERLHHAVPRRVDESLRAAGITGWQIYLRDDVLTHCVHVENRERMEKILDVDPTSPWWLAQVAPFLIEGASPEPQRPLGRLLWDLSGSVREHLEGPDA
ncbi:L-rhamnose mutarotase [Microbacterium sp. P5_E9]